MNRNVARIQKTEETNSIMYASTDIIFVSSSTSKPTPFPMALFEAEHSLVQISNVPIYVGKTRQESVNIPKACSMILVMVATRRLHGVRKEVRETMFLTASCLRASWGSKSRKDQGRSKHRIVETRPIALRNQARGAIPRFRIFINYRLLHTLFCDYEL
jgi:hypothetical protein